MKKRCSGGEVGREDGRKGMECREWVGGMMQYSRVMMHGAEGRRRDGFGEWVGRQWIAVTQ